MSTAPPMPDDARSGLSWVRRARDLIERPLGELEPAYRRHFLKTDVSQATLGMAFMAIPMVLFAYSDLLLVGWGRSFLFLSATRLGFLVFTLAMLWRLRCLSTPAAYDRTVAAWTIVAILNAFAMNALRPPTQMLFLGIQSLALLAIYLVIPSHLSTRLCVASLVTVMVGVMHLSGQREVDPATQTMVWSTVTLTSLMGLMLSSRLQTLRRQQFLSLLELERTRDELYALATIDELTGLLNRRRLLELAEQDLARATRYGRPLSLIAIDLDHFKQINDRYGHAAGDAVLRSVAAVLLDQTRQHDLVGRMGGEEITIVLPETGLEAARQLAERIREQVGALRTVVDGAAISVTVSLGVAEAAPNDASILETLKRADRRLYLAKEHGRDRVEAA